MLVEKKFPSSSCTLSRTVAGICMTCSLTHITRRETTVRLNRRPEHSSRLGTLKHVAGGGLSPARLSRGPEERVDGLN